MTAVRPVMDGLPASPQAGFVARSEQVGVAGPATAAVGTAMAVNSKTTPHAHQRIVIMSLLHGNGVTARGTLPRHVNLRNSGSVRSCRVASRIAVRRIPTRQSVY